MVVVVAVGAGAAAAEAMTECRPYCRNKLGGKCLGTISVACLRLRSAKIEYTPWVKKLDVREVFLITSSNIGRFSNSFSGKVVGKFAILSHHTLSVSLHYHVKC